MTLSLRRSVTRQLRSIVNLYHPKIVMLPTQKNVILPNLYAGLCMRKFVPMEDTPLTLTATLPRDITRGRLRLILRQTLMLIQKQERVRVTDTQDLQLTLDMDLCQHHMVSILGQFRDMLYLLMLKVMVAKRYRDKFANLLQHLFAQKFHIRNANQQLRRNATMFPSNTVPRCQERFQGKNVYLYQESIVTMFQDKHVKP